MPNPIIDEKFYYYPPAVCASHTTHVTNHIDIYALTQGRPDFWITPDDGHHKKTKKIIILADWSLNKDPGKEIEISNTLNIFLQSGFEVKAIQEGILKNIYQPSDIDLDKITPLHTKTIKKILSSQGISTDQSYIFDYVTVHQGVLDLSHLT